MTGSSGQLASDNSDSLSTNSFSFIRTTGNIDPALTLRRKYGLMACSNESTDKMSNIEGDAIRAMRTRWESQMKHMDEMRNNTEEKCSNKRPSHPHINNSTTRKKRPAPQPPSGSVNRRSTTSRHSTGSIHTSSITSAGFTHVPGKRKAPSPPDHQTTQFNIPNPVNGNLPDLMDSSVIPAMTAPPVTENKWNNDLNCNLLVDETSKVKVFRYHQNKINNGEVIHPECPRNGILKLEGGVLRPLESTANNTNEQTNGTLTIDSNHRGMMTLPLKPWYKRGRNGQLHHNPSSVNASSRSKWKDAALLHPPVADASWAMGLIANHHAESTLINTIRTNYSSTVSPGGSTRSECSSSICSDESKGKQQRKSLLVNISQLDREATEIIQRERARESLRKRMEDDKFYCHHSEIIQLPRVPDVPEEAIQHPPEEKGTRQLINMFNSLTDSSATAINSQQKQTTVESNFRLASVQQADANYKSVLGHDTTSSSTVPEVAVPECSSTTNKAIDLNTKTITRLRVNRETIAASASPVGNRSELATSKPSIFNPKLEVVGVQHNGGARPKNSIVLSADKPSSLVNGYAKILPSGWECQICTLVNSEARLWCEACTALKPRHRPSSSQVVTQPVAKETIKTQEVSSASVTVTTAPNSPEALRQARLAFFLNGQQNKQQEVKKESDDQPGDKNNNQTNNKRRSQYGGTKVSSSCQTQDVKLPSNIVVQRPVSISDKPHVLEKTSANSNKVIVNEEPNLIDNNDVKPRVPAVILKDVTPTNFALLSPSRTQLSQYLQQQQATKSQSANSDQQSSNEIQKSTGNPSQPYKFQYNYKK